MNARELHEWIKKTHLHGVAISSDMEQTILRALALLASVEESKDELVREINSALAPSFHNTAMVLLHRQMFERAAARLIAQDERIAALEAELKAHVHVLEQLATNADGMIQPYVQTWRGDMLNVGAVIDAYRRDHKEGA